MLLNFKQEKHVNTSSLPIVSAVCMESTLHVMTRMENTFCSGTNHFNLYFSSYRGKNLLREETISGLREGWICSICKEGNIIKLPDSQYTT